MAKTHQKLHEALSTDDIGPLSFIVIVPSWQDNFGWQQLANSPYNIARIEVPALEHSYCHGALYRFAKEEYYPSPFDTSVIILQNADGAKKWPFSEQAKKEILASFSEARPSEAALRRQREQGLYIPKRKRIPGGATE